MSGAKHTPGPFGAAMDTLARGVGSWTDEQMVYAVEVIGEGDDPQVMLTGSTGDWMPIAQRWSFKGHPAVKAVVRLSQYRAALAEREKRNA